MVGLAWDWTSRRSIAARLGRRASRASVSALARRVTGCALALTLTVASFSGQAMLGDEPDRLKELQTSYVANAGQKMARAYHFGSQGPGDVFSNHTSHTNRLVPVYVFGSEGRPGRCHGTRTADIATRRRSRPLYGFLPENTVNPRAVYADQSDLYRVQKEAVARGVKHLFIVWFDGLDWPTTQAAAIVKTGKVYTEGKGSGLVFQDYDAGGTAQYGFVVTSPTHDQNRPDVDAQTVVIPPDEPGRRLRCADRRAKPLDARPAGPEGPRLPQGTVGQRGRPGGRAGRRRRLARLHRLVPERRRDDQRGQVVQQRGKRHRRRPARDDPVSRASGPGMESRHGDQRAFRPRLAGRDVRPERLSRRLPGPRPGDARPAGNHPAGAAGTASPGSRRRHRHGLRGHHQSEVAGGARAERGAWQPLHHRRRSGGDRRQERRQVRRGSHRAGSQRRPGTEAAAERRRGDSARLFGFFGRAGLDHLPYQTADGRYDPAPSIGSSKGELRPAESYTPADRIEQPTLAQMTEAALTVLAAEPDQPFALFIEAGDVDFALHANNLDNAIGAIYSGEEAVRSVIRWVESHSNWDDSVLIVSSDHGHYLVVDDPQALAGVK